jgi:hypothetical protein
MYVLFSYPKILNKQNKKHNHRKQQPKWRRSKKKKNSYSKQEIQQSKIATEVEEMMGTTPWRADGSGCNYWIWPKSNKKN